MTPRRGPATPDAIVQFIKQRASAMAPGQIRTELETDPIGQRFGVPPLRTIQAIAAKYRIADSDPWSLVKAELGADEIMLRVVAGVLGSTPLRWPTVERARWIVRLHAAVPDLIDQDRGWWELYRFAGDYQGRADRGERADDLDAYFALAPWRDGGAAYVAAIASGRVTRVHFNPFTDAAKLDALCDQLQAKVTP